MKSFAWTGRTLRVDLTNKKTTVEATSRWSERVLGGRGIGQLILFEEIEPPTDSLGAANKMVISTGALTGTLAPSAGRTSFDWKNVQTGGVASANLGGHFGSELKYAGFDSVILEGQSDQPVFLFIKDGEAQIQGASGLWGKTTWETEDILRHQLGEPDLRVISIGPAGENLVAGACIIGDRTRAVGRGGSGALLGAKKLKAVAVRGTQPVTVFNPEDFLKEVKRCWQKLTVSRTVGMLNEVGNQTGDWVRGARNHQEENWNPEKHDRLFGAFRSEFNALKVSCFCCPAQGSRFYVVKEGPYAGLACEGMELNAMRAFGPNLDIDYPPAVIKGHALCSQLGIDVDFAAAVLGWAFESYQRGVITSDDANGLNLVWGDYKSALRLLQDIALKRGLGDLLAQGVKKASETVGRGSEQWALHIKGADQNEWRMRYDKGWALGIIVALRGGGHSEGAPVLSICGPYLTPERSMSLWGVSDVGSPQDYKNKAHVVFWMRKLKAAVDALGMCFITSPWYDLTDTNLLQLEDYTALLNAGTGMGLTSEELMEYGQRIYNIEKAFNALHTGFSRKDDMPPPRFMNEPIRSGEFAEDILHKEGLEQMLDEYYQLEKWDLKTGLQTEQILLELGLQDVAKKLETYGRLS